MKKFASLLMLLVLTACGQTGMSETAAVTAQPTEAAPTPTAEAAIQSSYPEPVVSAYPAAGTDEIPTAEWKQVPVVGEVISEAFSDTQPWLAVLNSDGDLWIWDYQQSVELQRINVLEANGNLLPVYFLPGGTQLVCQSGNGGLVVWDTSTGEEVFQLSADNQDQIQDMTVSADGKYLALAYPQQIAVWDLETQQAGDSIKLDPIYEDINRLAYSPDGTTLAIGMTSGVVLAWDSTEGIRATGSVDGEVRQLAFSPDGSLLAVQGKGGSVQIWDSAAWTETSEIDGSSSVDAIAFSADGTLLAVAGMDDGIQLWNMAQGESEVRLPLDGKEITGLVFSQDGTLLAGGTDSQQVLLWTLPVDSSSLPTEISTAGYP